MIDDFDTHMHSDELPRDAEQFGRCMRCHEMAPLERDEDNGELVTMCCGWPTLPEDYGAC